MPVRAIYYWDCETKPIVSNDRYRYTFHQTYCLGRQVSIDLSPNLPFRKIGIDRPFTTLLVSDDRYRQTFHHSIVSDDKYRYVDLSPFYCFSVGEQWRSKTARLGTINSSSPFIHAARPSCPAENPRIRRCLSLLCPKKLKVDGLINKVVRSSSLQCFRATCLCAVQFLLMPWIIPYRIGYWANNRSANYEDRSLSRITIARLRGLSIGIVSNNRIRAVATIAYCATGVLTKMYVNRYLGHQHNFKMTPNRLSFEQYLFIATNQSPIG